MPQRPITLQRARNTTTQPTVTTPRRTTAQRGYGHDWQQAAIEFLHRNPLCRCDDCVRTGAIVAANVVDHIVPIAIAPELRMVESNWRPMAKRHHDRHTARTMGKYPKRPHKPT